MNEDLLKADEFLYFITMVNIKEMGESVATAATNNMHWSDIFSGSGLEEDDNYIQSHPFLATPNLVDARRALT